MSSLPPVFVNGDVLDASELNLMRAARNGGFTPIDPTTNNEIDATFDFGTPTARYKDGTFSGKVSAEGQNTFRARPTAQFITGGSNDNIGFAAEIVNIGTAFTQQGGGAPPFEEVLLNETGLYLVVAHIRLSNVTNMRVIIRHERPAGVFLEDIESSDQIDGANISATIQGQSGDSIEIRGLSVANGTISIANSDMTITRLY